jgi:serine/threonine-protein kinase HipA
LNVKIILPKDKEDMALMLGGKKMNFSKDYFDRFANVLKLNEIQINAVYKRLVKWLPEATQLIEISFLTEENRIAYTNLVTNRVKQFTA